MIAARPSAPTKKPPKISLDKDKLGRMGRPVPKPKPKATRTHTRPKTSPNQTVPVGPRPKGPKSLLDYATGKPWESSGRPQGFKSPPKSGPTGFAPADTGDGFLRKAAGAIGGFLNPFDNFSKPSASASRPANRGGNSGVNSAVSAYRNPM